MSWLLPLINNILSPFPIPQLSLLNPVQSPIAISQSCSTPALSCPSTTPAPIDTCCLNHPSGHFLLAQFWDTQPALGPNDSWTLHGLWPDYCTGGFPANCNHAREMPGSTIATIVDDASNSTHPGLRQYMDEFWKGLHGDDDLWSHEWNKHGTCVSTLEERCYDYSPPVGSSSNSLSSHHPDLLDYLYASTTLHSTLQTHKILALHNITPSHTTTYSLAEIQSALATSHDGYKATVKCNYRHELNEVWMHYLVLGSLRNTSASPDSGNLPAKFIPVPPDGLVSTCPKYGIKYLPKTPDEGPKPTHTSHVPGPTGHPGTGKPFDGRGFLKVHVLPDPTSSSTVDNDVAEPGEGCLIRQGYWYTSGQCATYHTKLDVISSAELTDLDGDEGPLFTLASSYAPCAILEEDGTHGTKGEFVCANRLPVQSIFGVKKDEYDSSVLSWKGNTTFYADRVPARFEKIRVFGNDGDGERSVKLEIYWQGV